MNNSYPQFLNTLEASSYPHAGNPLLSLGYFLTTPHRTVNFCMSHMNQYGYYGQSAYPTGILACWTSYVAVGEQ